MGKWLKRAVEEWSAIFDACARSGKSASRYCREHGINYKQFLYFRKKMRDGCKTHSLAVMAAGSRPVPRRGGFVSVAVERGSAVRLKFPRGLVVEGDSLPPPAWIVEVALRWAGAEPC